MEYQIIFLHEAKIDCSDVRGDAGMEEKWQETRIHRTILLQAETVTRAVTGTDRTKVERTLPEIRIRISPPTKHQMQTDRAVPILQEAHSKIRTKEKQLHKM